jgi:hypothetical protein
MDIPGDRWSGLSRQEVEEARKTGDDKQELNERLPASIPDRVALAELLEQDVVGGSAGLRQILDDLLPVEANFCGICPDIAASEQSPRHFV